MVDGYLSTLQQVVCIISKLDIFLWRRISMSIGVFISPHSPSENYGYEHVEHKQIQLTLCFDLHVIYQLSTPSPHLEMVTLRGFGSQLIGILKSFPCLKTQ